MVGRRARRLLLFVAAMNLHALNLNDVADAQAALRSRDAVLRPPVAEFVGGRDAVAADDALPAAADADLGVMDDEAAIAALRARDGAAAGRAPVPEFIAEWATDEEMLAANAALVSEWMEEFLEGAEGDLYEQESDAAAGQDRQAEMKAAFAKAPPLFQAMLARVMTDDEFSQIRDGICEALFANWPLLCQIHAKIFDASQPKYRKSRSSTEESTSNNPKLVREKCGKCPAMISRKRVGEHRAICKGPSTVDVFMYTLACLLGTERTMPKRCVRSLVRFVWRASASALVHACVRACVLGTWVTSEILSR
jgi:hypothetical protein